MLGLATTLFEMGRALSIPALVDAAALFVFPGASFTSLSARQEYSSRATRRPVEAWRRDIAALDATDFGDSSLRRRDMADAISVTSRCPKYVARLLTA